MYSNIRIGFATNSSSTHSIIITHENHGHIPSVSPYEPNNFGWEEFVLKTEKEKAPYVMLLFYYHFMDENAPVLKTLNKVKEIFPEYSSSSLFSKKNRCEDEIFGYVDHQSALGIPEPYTDEDNITTLANWMIKHIIKDPRVIIAGGNDNGGPGSHTESLLRIGKELETIPYPSIFSKKTEVNVVDLPLDCGEKTVFKTNKDGSIAIFSQITGNKVRTHTTDNTIPETSDIPELVDLKITDYCTRECPNCYQGSTRNGKHASFENLMNVITELRQQGVFEIAIGGGEPTSHPDIVKVLTDTHKMGMVPNLSTGSYNWLNYSLNAKLIHAIDDYVGAIAYSVTNKYSAEVWAKSCIENHVTPNLHLVLGLLPVTEIDTIFNIWNNISFLYRKRPTIVLLKYKGGIGRAASTPPHSYIGPPDEDDIFKLIQKYSETGFEFNLAVDSFLTNEVATYLPNINPILYENGDGKFSMYIDVVDPEVVRYAAHSFIPKDKQFMVPHKDFNLDTAWENVLNYKEVYD